MKSQTYKEAQQQFRELAQPKIAEGYITNSFPNRRTRRQKAKEAGYFKREDGANGWGMYIATGNKQTIGVI